METKFVLTSEDYKKAVKFAMKLYYTNGKPRGDWRNTGTQRGLGTYITDFAIGKLAEIGFSKFLKINWAMEASLDFNIYPGGQTTDKGDILSVKSGGVEKTPSLKVDVKATKPNSKWAMLDKKEFENRPYGAYAWVKINLRPDHIARPIYEAVRNGNLQEIADKIPKTEEIECNIQGYLYRDEATTKGIIFNKGDEVYDPYSRIGPRSGKRKRMFFAKTDNIAITFETLKNSEEDWQEFIKKLTI